MLVGLSSGTPDAHHGFKLRSVNPATGASPMPTIGSFAQRLPAGCGTTAVRWADGAVPSGHALQLRAEHDAVLFSVSDRPVQQALGLGREERL